MPKESRICQNCKQDFQIESADLDFYARIQVPAPTWCPECRLMRRLAWRNERSLYKRTCDLCHRSIISVYSPDKQFKVYCPSCFYSDRWDALIYGREYDFSKPFFVQFSELQKDVPQLALFQANMIDSPWCNYEIDDKNCYLNIGGANNEDSAYSQYGLKMKESFDNYSLEKGEFCYETSQSISCYKTFYSKFCYECRDTYFSFDCRNCANIFGCTGLRSKQNYIFNKPVSKEDFDKFIKENMSGSRALIKEMREKASVEWKRHPQRALFIDRSVNCTGNLINASKNCKSCWVTGKTEDSKYQAFNMEIKDSYDVTSVWSGELLYELMGGRQNIMNARFSVGIIGGSSDIEYSYLMVNSHSCFGSSSVKGRNYCILNKQYTKAEYADLRAKILKHIDDMPYIDSVGRIYRYGEFFAIDLSPFAYNESTACEFFPIGEAEAERKGLNWSKYEGESNLFSDYIIPDNIRDVKDDILKKVLKCEISGKAYRLIPTELAFYRRFNIPIPRLAPFERHKQRLRFISEHLKLHSRTCGKCGRNIESVYKVEEFPIVYCEECYLREVV